MDHGLDCSPNVGTSKVGSVSAVRTPPADLAKRLMAASDEILAGDAEVRLEEVAASVGVARTTLYYYFSGRDDLVSFVLTEHIDAGAEAIRRATETAGSPVIKIRAVVVALIQFLGGHPGLCAALLASLGAAGRMNEALQANETHIASPVRELVAEGIASGELRDGDPADITSAILGAILLTVLARTFQNRDTTSAAIADQLADQILHGPLA